MPQEMKRKLEPAGYHDLILHDQWQHYLLPKSAGRIR